jgi:hypothetical protein
MKIDYKLGYGYLRTPAWRPKRALGQSNLGLIWG